LAHLAIAEQAWQRHGLARVELSVSTVALAKETVTRPLFEHRIEVLEAVATPLPWLTVRVTDHQLLVDVASGYDLLIMGADKWQQIQELRWYDDDPAARDAALAGLPPVAIAERDTLAVPDGKTLDVDPEAIDGVSSTRARAGAVDLLPEPARTFATETGAWIDPERYERWLSERQP
jgi:hypothetical protein